MRVHLIPFAPVRVQRDLCLQHAQTCHFYSRRGHSHCEALAWEWLLRWAGAPV